MKKSLFAILFLSAVLAAGSYMLLNSRRMQLFGTLVARVETTQKRVALTFDDAPTPQTLCVLALLKQYRIPATFYAVGSQLERYPEIARSIVADGHELGNHSYSHQRFVFKTWDFTDRDLCKISFPPTTETQKQVFGCFRPQYLLILPKYPLNPPRIPDNKASGPPFRRKQAHLACWRLSKGSNTSPSDGFAHSL